MTKTYKKNSKAYKVLEAAEAVFIEKGFTASSIQDIAEKAGVKKSLIFYHFATKEDLWKKVKKNMVEAQAELDLDTINFPTDSFKNFLKSFFFFRFEVYEKSPNLTRLISWERLEQTQQVLSSLTPQGVLNLTPYIKTLQAKGEVRDNLDPEMVGYFIVSSSSMPYMDLPPFFKRDHQGKQTYYKMLIEGLHLAFGNHVSSESL